MQTLSRTPFTTVKTEGGILPADLLSRVAAGDVNGLRPEDYHLAPSERLNEAISRSWNRLLGVWRSFDDQRRDLSEADRGVTLTRERWLLILFQELGYGRLSFAGKLAITDGHGDSQAYPISHVWQQTPIHLVSFRQELDRRDPTVGRSPHSLLQEFLNRWDASLWGFTSNGLRLRLLRDNASLTRAAYVEFDLEAMLAGELYSDFTLLWLVCHQSRVEGLGSREWGVGSGESEAPTPHSPPPTPSDCWLERWSQLATEQGARALDALRDGVQEAIAALGKGFLAHKANGSLRDDLRAGRLSGHDYYRQLLRLVYRLIFLCVAEDRDLLLLPGVSSQVRQRYRSYSVARLRELAAARRGSLHPDLYRGLRLLMVQLRAGYAPLGLPGLGSFLFSARATPHLDSADIANRDLLDALRSLAFAVENGVRRPVDYRNLDSEELGSVYESLLELHPQLNLDAAAFTLEVVAGSERKTTGTHYTPTSLVNSLLDTALEPVIAERLAAATRSAATRSAVTRNAVTRNPEDPSGHELRVTSYEPPFTTPESALLSIKVLDYACGSGHMLIGAGRRLARHLARARTGDEEPAPQAIRTALRDVVRHCLYGVDLNEMAVELCKVALWMESLEPGKPLTFLDKNIQCGNSLIGVAPGLEIGEMPDDAFQPLSGDDRKTAVALRARNRRERGGQGSFLRELLVGAEDVAVAELEQELAQIEALDEDDLETVALKAEVFQDYLSSPTYRRKQGEHDLWSAAFFWPIPAGDAELMAAPTQAELAKRRRYWTENDALAQQARQIAQRHSFFHWELAFPTVFRRGVGSGERGVGSGELGVGSGASGSPSPPPTPPPPGFDVVLSNPPWERIKLQEKEWFASRSPQIAAAANAAVRKRMIEALHEEDPALHAAYLADLRGAEGESAYIRTSGRYPLCGRGDVNTYAVFAELARQVLSPAGRAGIIVPSGIATDDTTKFYFQEIMETGTLASLYDFENRRAIFPGVHRSYKFCLLTLRGVGSGAWGVGSGERRVQFPVPRTASPAPSPHSPLPPAEFVFFALDVADLRDPQRRFTLSAADIALLNPNTRTCPIFRSQRDAELTKAIYRRVPVLIKEGPPEVNPWGVRFATMFHMSNDSHLFRTRSQLEAEGWRLVGNRFVRPASAGARPATVMLSGSAGQHRPFQVASEASGPTVLGASRAGAGRDASLADRRDAGRAPDSLSMTGGEEVYLPLYEAKMMHHFDHRWATYEGAETRDLAVREKEEPGAVVLPRYWVSQHEVDARLSAEQRGWLLGFRDITNTTNERTAIFSAIPRVGVGNKVPLLQQDNLRDPIWMLATSSSSYAFDFAVRQKVGGTTMNFFIAKQLPVLPPATYTQPCPWSGHSLPPTPHSLWLLPRVLELTYTAWDLLPFAQDVIAAWQEEVGSEQRAVEDAETTPHSPVPRPQAPAPFRWDEQRRFLLRCELDAAFFHLYGIARDDVDYILETFPIVKRKEVASHGEYRTKRVILEIYDAMQQAMESGEAYQTRLDPPPADPRVAHVGEPPAWAIGPEPANNL